MSPIFYIKVCLAGFYINLFMIFKAINLCTLFKDYTNIIKIETILDKSELLTLGKSHNTLQTSNTIISLDLWAYLYR